MNTPSPELPSLPEQPKTAQDRALENFVPRYDKVKQDQSKITTVPNPAMVLFNGQAV